MRTNDKIRIPVTRSWLPDIDEYIDEIRVLWENRWLTNTGIKHQQFEEELRRVLEIDQVNLLVNGHAALEYALQAMGLQGEVITTPFTFASTTTAIVRCGLTPVFCDINPIDYTIDADKIEALITEKTCAILPVHVYGNICDVEKIEQIAKKYHLKVIYDAAHAFGVRYQGKSIANWGDVNCYSLHATKVLHSVEGGIICCRDEMLHNRIDHMKNFGLASVEHLIYAGGNAKMNEFCAAMGLCNLRHFPQMLEARKDITDAYNSYLSDLKGVRLNFPRKDVQSNYAYYPVLFDETYFPGGRESVIAHLKEHGIAARRYFWPLTSEAEFFESTYSVKDTPIAYRVSNEVLALPLYGEMSLSDVQEICTVIHECQK